MPFFRKKPVVIEAIQLTWQNWSAVCELFPNKDKRFEGKTRGVHIDADGKVLEPPDSSDFIGMEIETLEGVMLARQDDWIIKGVNGEVYPCKPDIFEKTYEAVDAPESAAGR